MCCFQPLFGAGLGLGMIITKREKERRHEGREGYFGESQVSLDHKLANAGLIKDPRLGLGSDSEPANHEWPPHTILTSSVCDTKQRRAGPRCQSEVSFPECSLGIPFIQIFHDNGSVRYDHTDIDCPKTMRHAMLFPETFGMLTPYSHPLPSPSLPSLVPPSHFVTSQERANLIPDASNQVGVVAWLFVDMVTHFLCR